jgi:hypothetical protein
MASVTTDERVLGAFLRMQNPESEPASASFSGEATYAAPKNPLGAFIRMQNPTAAVATGSFASKTTYKADKRTEVGLPFYTDYLSAEAYVRLIFAIRVSDLNTLYDSIVPTPPIQRTIKLVFTIIGKTYDNYTWCTKYRLTLNNRNRALPTMEGVDKYTQYHEKIFRIDSYDFDNQTTERLNLNGFTRTVRNPEGQESTVSYLTCQNSDPFNQPVGDNQVMDISINRDQFYLFDVFLSDDETNHFGINGYQTRAVFKKTTLQLFNNMPDLSTKVSGAIEFQCEFEEMPVASNNARLTVDVTSVWAGLAGKDTSSLKTWNIFELFFARQTGDVIDLGNGSIEDELISFNPLFYINAINGLRNEVDRSNLIVSANQTVRAVWDIVNIYNAVNTTAETHIVLSSKPIVRGLEYADEHYQFFAKQSTIYTDNCNDSSTAYISLWFYSTDDEWLSDDYSIVFFDDKDPSIDKHYYFTIYKVRYTQLIVGWGKINRNTMRWSAEIKSGITLRIRKGWQHLQLYLDCENGTIISRLNGIGGDLFDVETKPDLPNKRYDKRTTLSIMTRGSWPWYDGILSAPCGADLLYPIVYCKSTQAKNPLIPWTDLAAMEQYFINKQTKRPIYPGIDGFFALGCQPDFYCNGVNGLGIFANAAQNTLCLGTPYIQVGEKSRYLLISQIYTMSANVIRAELGEALSDVYIPTLLDIANRALSKLGRPSVTSLLEDQPIDEVPFEIKEIRLALPLAMLTASSRDFGFNRYSFHVKRDDTKNPYDTGVDSRYRYYGELPTGIATVIEVRTKDDRIIAECDLVGRSLWILAQDDELILKTLKEVDYKSENFMALLAKDKDIWVTFAGGELASRIAGPVNATTGGSQIAAENEIYRMSESTTRERGPNKVQRDGRDVDYRSRF